jgi:hypothetical protein
VTDLGAVGGEGHLPLRNMLVIAPVCGVSLNI